MDSTATHQIDIDAPPEKVFPVAADPESQLRWDHAGIITVEKVTPGPLTQGSRYRGRWKRFGRMEYTFAAYDPPRRFTHDAATFLGRMIHTYTLEAVDEGTRFGQHLELIEPNLIGRLTRPMTGPIMHRRLAQIGAELKAYVEAHPQR